MAKRTPLAWRNLTHDVRRLLLALGGVAFAVLLMCMQLAFQEALFDSTLAMVRKLKADLVIVSSAQYTVVVREPFSRRRLYQALACPGVVGAYPMYLETQRSLLKNLDQPSEGTSAAQPIRVLAFNPDDPVMNLPEVARNARQLRLPNTALIDVKSKVSAYGQIKPGSQIELAGTRIRIVDTFSIGTDFTNDGNLITSAMNYRQLFGRRDSPSGGMEDVDLGLVHLAPTHRDRLESVRSELRRMLPTDVSILTRREFEAQERRFWATSTPIGTIFWLGTMMGFVVGVVICYQILYTDIADHMGEFATLKAMGYPRGYFIRVVLDEAMYLSILGFIPGVLISQLLCGWVAEKTSLPVSVSLVTGSMVLALSIGMCVTSGCLTIRKVLSADPAELF